jgi:hypothetical protein
MLVRAVKIRYKTGLAVAMIVSAVFIIGTSVLTGPSLSIISGVIVMIVGAAYLVRPLAELTETELTVFALFGPLKKQFPVAGLRVVDGRIYSGEKKVPLPAWTTNGEDFHAVLARVQSRAAMPDQAAR